LLADYKQAGEARTNDEKDEPQMKEVRDSRGHFAKGNVPWNKRHKIIFTCKYCGEQKPIEEMEVATRFFPPLVVCRDCWKLLEVG
jgi:hypothetical protein